MLELTVFIKMNGTPSQMLFLTICHHTIISWTKPRGREWGWREREEQAGCCQVSQQQEKTDWPSTRSKYSENDHTLWSDLQSDFLCIGLYTLGRWHGYELLCCLSYKETELEREQANLQTQVERLQKEIEKLVSHTPVCLLGCDGQPQAQPLPPFALTIHPMDNSTIAHPLGPPHAVKQEPQEEMLFSLHYH